jgi:predicted glycosyltransferase
VRALFWVQHLLGSGHLRRTLTIAGACAARGMTVTVVSGGAPMPWRAPPGVRLMQLPWVKAADAGFRRLVDATGEAPSPATMRCRAEQLRALVDETVPDILVTEMFPFGRRAFREEVLGLLHHARTRKPACRIVASVRDVLVTGGSREKAAWMRDQCREWYDRVLVHGDPRILPFEASFPYAHEIADRVVYTGYVHSGGAAGSAARDEVLTSAGGGAVGGRLLRVAIAARPRTRLRDMPWRLLTGANLAQVEFEELTASAGQNLLVERHRDDVMDLLSRAAVSISQAGYNTVVECLVAGAPMVLVPFADHGEDEQTTRARRLAELCLAAFVDPTRLGPEALARAVDAAAERGAQAVTAIRVDGAERSVDALAALHETGRDG